MNVYSYEKDFNHKGIKYKILDTTIDGYYIVAKQEDIEKGVFPIPLFIVPMKESG